MRKQKKFPVISLGITRYGLHDICTNENPHCLYYVDCDRCADHSCIKIYKLVETLHGVYARTLWDSTETFHLEEMNGIAFYLNAKNTFETTRESCVYSRLAPYFQGKVEDKEYTADGKYPKNDFITHGAAGEKIKVTTFGMESTSDFRNLVAVKFEVVGGEEAAK